MLQIDICPLSVPEIVFPLAIKFVKFKLDDTVTKHVAQTSLYLDVRHITPILSIR